MSRSGTPEVSGSSVIAQINQSLLQNKAFIDSCKQKVADDESVKKDDVSQGRALGALIKEGQVKAGRQLKIALMEVISTETSFISMIRDLTEFVGGILQDQNIVANLSESERLMLNEVYVQYRQIEGSPLILNLMQEHKINVGSGMLSDEDADRLFNILNSPEGISAVTRSMEDQFKAIRNFPALIELATSLNFKRTSEAGAVHVFNFGESKPKETSTLKISDILIQAVQRPPRYKILYEAVAKTIPGSVSPGLSTPLGRMGSSIEVIASALDHINSVQQYQIDEFSHRVFYGQVSREIYKKLPPKPWDQNTTAKYKMIDEMILSASTALNTDIQLAKNIVSDIVMKQQTNVSLSKSENAIVKLQSIPADANRDVLIKKYTDFIDLMNQNEYLYKQLAALINIKFAGEYTLDKSEMPSANYVNKMIADIQAKISANEKEILAKKSEIKKIVLSNDVSKNDAYKDILESIRPPTQAALQENFRVNRDMIMKKNMLNIVSRLIESYDKSFTNFKNNFEAINKIPRKSDDFQALLSSKIPQVSAMAAKWGPFDIFSKSHNKDSAYHHVVSKNSKIQSELFLMQNALNNIQYLENKRLAMIKLLDAINSSQEKRAVIANISSNKTLLNSLPDDLKKEMVKWIAAFDKRTTYEYSDLHQQLTSQINLLEKQIANESKAVEQHDNNLIVARRECIRDLSQIRPKDHVGYIADNLLQELADHKVRSEVSKRISSILKNGSDPVDPLVKLDGARSCLEYLNKVLLSEGKSMQIPSEIVKGYSQMFNSVEKRLEANRSALESERVKLRDASHIVKPAAPNESERVKAIIQSLEAAYSDAKKMNALLMRQADFISSDKDIKLNNGRLAKYRPSENSLLHLINVLKHPNQDEKTIKDAFAQAIANKDISVTTRALLQSLSKQYNDRAKKPSLVGRIFSSSESRVKPTDQPDSTISRTVKR